MLTDEEIALIKQLAEVFNGFMKLPKYHNQDAPEFCDGVHRLQEKIMSRAATRAHPEVFSQK